MNFILKFRLISFSEHPLMRLTRLDVAGFILTPILTISRWNLMRTNNRLVNWIIMQIIIWLDSVCMIQRWFHTGELWQTHRNTVKSYPVDSNQCICSLEAIQVLQIKRVFRCIVEFYSLYSRFFVGINLDHCTESNRLIDSDFRMIRNAKFAN